MDSIEPTMTIQPLLASQNKIVTVTKKNMSAAKLPVVNPHAKARQPLAINGKMGWQSQQRIANWHKRKYKLCSNNSNKKEET